MIRAKKHHTLVYEAGREVEVIRAPDGRDFVQLIAVAPEGGGLFQSAELPVDIDDLGLPRGWALRTEKVIELLVIHLPFPAEALFFANGASFQGPVDVF